MKKLIALAAASFASLSAAQADLTVYSNRQDFLLEPLLDAFTDQTGIEVTSVFLKSGIVERLRTEGALSPADLIITTDISRLEEAREQGVLATLPTDLMGLERVPDNLKHAENQWVALTTRARVAYVPADGDITALSYQDIADEQFAQSGLCIRNAQHVYNIGLVAGYLSHYGEDATIEWLEGLKNNLARTPDGNDRAQIRGVGSGECGVALSNSYYYGVMLSDPQQEADAKRAQLIFPTFGSGEESLGTHINVSGIAQTAASDNQAQAQAFISFMLSDEAQAIYAEVNHEYPVVPGVPASELVASWGEAQFDDLDLTTLAANRVLASELIDDVGLND